MERTRLVGMRNGNGIQDCKISYVLYGLRGVLFCSRVSAQTATARRIPIHYTSSTLRRALVSELRRASTGVVTDMVPYKHRGDTNLGSEGSKYWLRRDHRS